MAETWGFHGDFMEIFEGLYGDSMCISGGFHKDFMESSMGFHYISWLFVAFGIAIPHWTPSGDHPKPEANSLIQVAVFLDHSECYHNHLPFGAN